MTTNKILGIDLGTNSLGWSLLSSSEGKNKELKLQDKGVVLFDEGVIIEKGNEKSKAAERTKFRSARRLVFRRKLRKYQTLKTLAKYGMVPLSITEIHEWRKSNFTKYPQNKDFINWLRTDDKILKNPYFLRSKAVHKKLNSLELGRVFYHLAQRRGFLSNRLEKAKNEKETGVVKKSITEITQKIKETGSKSLGDYFWKLYQQDRNESINKIRKQYLGRKEHYLQEFELICKTQELPTKLCQELKKAIFYQRPLKSQKGLVGNCVFEPRKPKMPVSHPLFEAFRMWSFVNNIKIKTPEDKYLRFLTSDEKLKILPLFYSAPSKKTIKFKDIAKKLILPGHKKAKMAYYKSKKAREAHYLFNYDLDQSVSASPVTALFYKYLGEDWEQKVYSYKITKPNGEFDLKSADYHDIWHVLFTFEDEEKLREYFVDKLKFPPEIAEKFVHFNLPSGYASLSFKAVRNILPFLQEGFTYDKAVLLAKIPEILGMEIWGVEENREKIVQQINRIFKRNTNRQKIISAVNSTLHQIHKQEVQEPIAIESFLRENMEKVFGKQSLQKLIETDDILQTAFVLLKEKLRYKSIEKQIIKQQSIEQQIKDYLKKEFLVDEKDLKKLYHPSMMDIYKKASLTHDGKRYLGSPIINSIKNPVMMRSMHLLRKLINKLLADEVIDNQTVVHIELARDLNDANKRAAIHRYQREREKENATYKEEIEKTFREQGISRMVTQDDIKRYRLWKEQNEISIYTGEPIALHELFDGNKYDFEHTVPRSQSYDNSLANLTITESSFNRDIKKNKLPSELDNFEDIKLRLQVWQDKVDVLNKKISKLKAASKQAVTKEDKDRIIQNRHYLNLQKDYWEKKVKNFMLEEITNSFKYSQLNDTRLITKYARAYLKSAFDKVHVVSGSMVAQYRKVWGLQDENEKKSRSNHIHHAIDATVIAAMTRHVYNKLAEAWHLMENDKIDEAKKLIRKTKPWKTFTEDVKNLDKDTLIYHDFRDLLPKHTKKKIRNRDVIQYSKVKSLPEWIRDLEAKEIYKEGEDYKVIFENGKKLYKIPKFSEGDTARGVLHRESFYGAIAKKDKDGNIITGKDGNVEVVFVKRKAIDDLKESDVDNIVDPVIRKIVARDLKSKNTLQKEINDLKKALRKATEEQEKQWQAQIDELEQELQSLFRLPTKKGGFVPIKKVRLITRVTEPLPNFKRHRDLSDKPYKQWYYVENKENYAMAFYEGEKKGKLERDFEMVKNIEAAAYFKRSQREYRKEYALVPETKKGLPLKYVLKKGMSVLFYENTPDELRELPKEDLVKRLYVITEIQKAGRIYFIPNYLAGEMLNLKKQAVSKLDFTEKMLLLSRANWNFIVNNIDFILNINGEITFKF